MKKISFIAVAGALMAFGAVAANNDTVNGDMPAPSVDSAGFSGGEAIVTVAQAKALPDDTVLVLRGNIIESLGDERYTFQDATDTITVAIEDDTWRGNTVQPTDTVVLYGEVDANNGVVQEIDVTRLETM